MEIHYKTKKSRDYTTKQSSDSITKQLKWRFHYSTKWRLRDIPLQNKVGIPLKIKVEYPLDSTTKQSRDFLSQNNLACVDWTFRKNGKCKQIVLIRTIRWSDYETLYRTMCLIPLQFPELNNILTSLVSQMWSWIHGDPLPGCDLCRRGPLQTDRQIESQLLSYSLSELHCSILSIDLHFRDSWGAT